MSASDILDFTHRGLMLTLWLTLPAAATAVVVGTFFALVQATTQLQDQTVSAIVKLVAVAAVLAIAGRWMGGAVLQFVDELWRAGGMHAPAPTF